MSSNNTPLNKGGRPRLPDELVTPGALRTRRWRERWQQRLLQKQQVQDQTPSKTVNDHPKPVETPVPLSSIDGQPLTGTPLRRARVLPDGYNDDDYDNLTGSLQLFGPGRIDPKKVDPTAVSLLRSRLADRRQLAKQKTADIVTVQKEANSQINATYDAEFDEVDDTYDMLLAAAFVPDDEEQPTITSSPPISSSPPPKLPSPVGVNGPPDEDDDDLLLGSPLGTGTANDVASKPSAKPSDVDSDVEDANEIDNLFGFQFGQDTNNENIATATPTATPSSLFPAHFQAPGKGIPPASFQAIFGSSKPAPFISLDNVDTSIFKNNNPNLPNYYGNNTNNGNVNVNAMDVNAMNVNSHIDENTMMDET